MAAPEPPQWRAVALRQRRAQPRRRAGGVRLPLQHRSLGEAAREPLVRPPVERPAQQEPLRLGRARLEPPLQPLWAQVERLVWALGPRLVPARPPRAGRM